VVVKEVLPRGPWRRLADLFRRSAGRRAWSGGHGLAARFLGAATPLAYLERRRWGVPAASWVFLEDLRPAIPADRVEGDAAALARTVETLGALAADLHARGADHGDLKSSHVYLDPADPEAAPRLLDLEGVRFGRRVGARRRARALAQLNASLPDRFPDDARRRAFERYARRLPFGRGRRARRRALRDVVARSRAREHRWSGEGCDP
jgi:hypothetical protein